MLKKLKTKFVLINMAIVLTMLLIIFGLVFHLTAQNLQDQSDAILNTLTNSARDPSAMFRQQQVSLPYILIMVGARGEVFASGVTGYDLTDEAFLQMLVESVQKQGRIAGQLKSLDLQYRICLEQSGQLIAMVDISSQKHTLEALTKTGILTGILGLLAFFGISILLANWAVKPVDKAWTQQKQFVSDASHELKTPLTVILSNAELLQAEECSEEERLRYAQNITTMSGQMRKLTEGLLELARVDNGQVAKHFEPVDFSQLVAHGVLPFEPAFYEKEMELVSRVQPGITVNANAQYLNQVLDILLENALKYSDPGVVTVELKKHSHSQCMLSVSNPGAPVSPEDRERIFDRFYRSDQARQRSGSFGLGLSIAKSIVQEHHGRIYLQSNAIGNCFCVVLPTI